MKAQPIYKVSIRLTDDGGDYTVTRDGKSICGGTWLGEPDDVLIAIAIKHAAERGL